jgi:predicted nucleic acid-binding protein
MVIVDTNVIIDVLKADAQWYEWSAAQLWQHKQSQGLVINAVVYAELASNFANHEALEHFLSTVGIHVEPIPKPALYKAGLAYAQYKQRGGAKTGVLPDFFIGAHALISGYPLLTRDIARYKTNFPKIQLISP